MPSSSFAHFAQELQAKLKQPLPGAAAHEAMMARSVSRMRTLPNERTRRSAVLILFYPYQNEIYLPLILRPKYDGVHAGQMAFPGGRYEQWDESLIRTALRESQEEIGLRLTDVTVLGTLTELFIPPSNFLVLPVVATLPHRPDFYPDPREVDQVFEIAFSELADENCLGESQIEIRGETIWAPHYSLRGLKVWGATAMMISELLCLIKP